MTDLSEFFLNPRGFLKTNLLVMNTSADSVCGSQTPVLGNFTIEPDLRYDNVKRKSKYFWKDAHDVDVLKVGWKGGTGNGTVPGIWLPYEANKSCVATLPNDAPFMFTAPMSGCSFALSTFKNGSARVAHVNFQTDDGHIDTTKMKTNTSGFSKTVNRDAYRNKVRGKPVAPEREAGLMMTVIGANDRKKGWKFYGQQYELNLQNATVEYIDLFDLN